MVEYEHLEEQSTYVNEDETKNKVHYLKSTGPVGKPKEVTSSGVDGQIRFINPEVSSAKAGEQIRVGFQIRNTGGEENLFAFELEMVKKEGSEFIYGEPVYTELLPVESGWENDEMFLNIPADAPFGDYWITMYMYKTLGGEDPYRIGVGYLDEAWTDFKVDESELSKVKVTRIDVPESAEAGETIELKGAITNTGKSGDCRLSLLFYNLKPVFKILKHQSAHSDLDPSDVLTGKLEYKIPEGFDQASIKAGVCGYHKHGDKWIQDQCKMKEIEIGGVVEEGDITAELSGLHVPFDKKLRGQELVVEFKLKNTSDVTHTFAVGMTLTDIVPSPPWNKIELKPGEKVDTHLRATIPDDAPVGIHDFVVKAWRKWEGGEKFGEDRWTGGKLIGQLDKLDGAYEILEGVGPQPITVPDVDEEAPAWYELLLGWIVEILGAILGGFVEVLKQASFGWIGLFYWIFSGKKMTEADIAPFLTNHGGFFAAGNIILVPVKGINTKGEEQTELTPGDYFEAGLIIAMGFGKVIAAGASRFATALVSYLGGLKGLSIGSKTAASLYNPMKGVSLAGKNRGLVFFGKLLRVPKAAKNFVEWFFFKDVTWKALTAPQKMWAVFIRFNIVTDPIFISFFGKEMLEWLTGDTKARYRSLQITISKEMDRIQGKVWHAETKEDWGEIVEDLESIKPDIDEFGEILKDHDLFFKIKDRYPEAERSWKRWLSDYERFLNEAREHAGIEAPKPPVPETFQALVTHVVDGDTVDFTYEDELGEKIKDRCRLSGIDSPEHAYCKTDKWGKKNCYAEEFGARGSEDFLSALVMGKTVTVYVDPRAQRDVFGKRIMGLLEFAGNNVNLVSVFAGWSCYYPYSANKYVDDEEFKAAEKHARENLLGMWAGGEGKLGVSSTPSKAKIYVNGEDEEKQTAETLTLPPGEVQIGVWLEGHLSEEETITVERDEKKEIHFKLTPISDEAEVYINADKSKARIFIDDKETEYLTPQTLKFSRDDFDGEDERMMKFALEKPDYKRHEWEALIRLGEKKTFEIILEAEDATKGKVKITSSPSKAEIKTEDQPTKYTPSTIELDCGKSYSFKLELEDYEDFEFDEIYIVCGETVELHHKFKKEETTGKLKVMSSPSYATIVIDDKEVGVTTKTVELTPGTKTVALKKKGYQDHVFENVVVELGHQKDLYVELSKETPTTGDLTIKSSPSYAYISLEDASKNVTTHGVTPELIKKLTPGTYSITLSKSKHSTVSATVVVEVGKTKEVYLEMEKIEEIHSGLKLRSSPSNASIIINGEDTGYRSYKKLELDPGSYTVELVLSGYEKYSATVSVVAGKFTDIYTKLKKTAESGVKIRSSPSNAIIEIDGKATGYRTYKRIRLDPGDYEIKISRDGFEDYSVSVTIEAGKYTDVYAKLEPEPETVGKLHVTSKPSAAYIKINNTNIPRITPGVVTLDPGTYRVSCMKSGYESEEEEVTITAGERTDVNLVMEKIELAETEGVLSLKSKPTNAIITINEEAIGKLTPEEIKLEGGEYDIEVTKAGYESKSFHVSIENGKTTEKYVELEKTETPEGEEELEEEEAKEAELTYETPADWPWMTGFRGGGTSGESGSPWAPEE